jgi:hypothetical protein
MIGGGDPDNRRDFAGGFPDDRRDAFTAEGRKKKEVQVFEHVKRLIAARSALPALRGPDTTFLLAAGCQLAYLRADGDARALVAFNTGATKQTLRIDVAGLFADGTTLSNALTLQRPLVVRNGTLNVKLAPLSAAIFNAPTTRRKR